MASGAPGLGPIQSKALKAVVAVALLAVFLNAYWHTAIPGYLQGTDLCAKGCHVTPVLEPSKITHPWWCVGCHGFGVKSEILPGIPLHRDHELELAVEKYGECLMCHTVSDRLHRWHIETKNDAEVVKCVECHTNAYHGGHTETPSNKVCIRCHDAEAAHTEIVNKRLIGNCLACHGTEPIADAAELKRGAATYDAVKSLGTVLALEVGPRNATGCYICHNKPTTIGHLKHADCKVRIAPNITKLISCTDCHMPMLLHGSETPVSACTRCHHREDTSYHDKGWTTLLADCYSCHRGFRDNTSALLPARGCQACHRESYVEAAKAGLHASHLEAYATCTVCHRKAKTHTEFIESVREDPNGLCKRCHTDTGGLTSDALKELKKPVMIAGDPMHEKLVERADGDCMSCHYQWHLVSKPKLYVFYNTTLTR